MPICRKLFGLHELPNGVRTRGLTGEGSERYTAIHGEWSRCDASAEMANGKVVCSLGIPIRCEFLERISSPKITVRYRLRPYS